jgi:hypothetical protein
VKHEPVAASKSKRGRKIKEEVKAEGNVEPEIAENPTTKPKKARRVKKERSPDPEPEPAIEDSVVKGEPDAEGPVSEDIPIAQTDGPVDPPTNAKSKSKPRNSKKANPAINNNTGVPAVTESTTAKPIPSRVKKEKKPSKSTTSSEAAKKNKATTESGGKRGRDRPKMTQKAAEGADLGETKPVGLSEAEDSDL